ncbi:MAG: DUF1015 domain-containing protein [Planctomycetaceae bacterium]|nr:DUF1015 domain-containing protein [Planctomycetaceae bacterium]
MSKIIPFKAVRPTRDKAYLLSSRPSYSYNKKHLESKLEGNPYTFLHVINPEFREDDSTKPNTVERFEKVRDKYDEFKSLGYFTQDEVPAIYIYRQITPTNTYIGIIAAASVDDYLNGKIKVHEHTLSQREEMFKKYLNVCKFNAESVLLTYKDNEDIDALFEKYINTRSEYEFTNTREIKHDLWVVSDQKDIAALQDAFTNVEHSYIADGHHRVSSSTLYTQSQREKGYNGDEDFNYFMAFYIAESKLRIFSYNRTVSSLNDLTSEEFLLQIEKAFTLTKSKEEYHPKSLHNLSMYFDESWYSLTIKDEFIDNDNPVGCLDAQLLSTLVLSPILGIHDLKTDNRVNFIEGTKGMEALQESVDSNISKVAFGFFPVSIDQLKRVADTNNIMPPKSTWIEPKIRSGLTVFEF